VAHDLVDVLAGPVDRRADVAKNETGRLQPRRRLVQVVTPQVGIVVSVGSAHQIFQ
jgi:hypothetical protein